MEEKKVENEIEKEKEWVDAFGTEVLKGAEAVGSTQRAIELAWRDISVTSMDGQKMLLAGATGSVQGKFLAIMGPSVGGV